MPTSTPPPWYLRARVKTRHLMLLVAIGDEGNIHRAAERLSVSQPAASKLLKNLEEALGVTLFERLPRGMRPTSCGEAMIRHARTVMSSLAQAGSELEALESGRSGVVSVGTIIGPALNVLPAAMATISREHAAVRVQLAIESSDVLLEQLAQSKLDIMIGRLFEPGAEAQFSYERLAHERVCAVARPSHPLVGKTSLKLRDLVQVPWIVPPPGSALRHRFDLMFHEARLGLPQHLIETSSILFLTKMLQESDFVAVVPTDVARYYSSYGMVATLPIQLSCTMDAFGIILRKDGPLSPAAQIVLKALKTVASSTYAEKPAAASASQTGVGRMRGRK